MPGGFQSFLPDGQTIQIDEEYKNLEFKGKFQLVATNQISIGSPNTYDVSIQVGGVVNPIVAIFCPGVPVALLSTIQQNGVVTYRFGALSNTAPFLVYVFDNPTPSGANNGFQVFNSRGELVFDALKKYLRVVSSTTFADYGNVNIGIPGGGTFAYVPSGFLGYFEDYHDSYEWGAPFSVKTKGACFWSMNGNLLVPTLQQFWTGSRGGIGTTSPFTYEVKAGTIQIVNVTGL